LYKYAGYGYYYGSHFKIVPVSFNHELSKRMLGHLQDLISKHLIKIHPKKFEKLVVALRTAYARDMTLDKQETSYDDILDAFRLSLLNYPFKKEL
jgi:hypothetical protein